MARQQLRAGDGVSAGYLEKEGYEDPYEEGPVVDHSACINPQGHQVPEGCTFDPGAIKAALEAMEAAVAAVEAITDSAELVIEVDAKPESGEPSPAPPEAPKVEDAGGRHRRHHPVYTPAPTLAPG